MGKLKSILSQAVVKAIKLSAYVRRDGALATYQRVTTQRSRDLPFAEIARTPLYTEAELAQQRQAVFPRDICVSLLLPVRHADEEQLRQTIESVLAQSYGNWELCICADRCPEVSDSRIRFCQSAAETCAERTNECFALSQGSYIALLGEGDILHPAALHEIVRAVCDTDAELLYTDEAPFTSVPADADEAYFKSACAPDSLLSTDYMGNLTVCARSLFESVGGLRSGYEGAALYDFRLRTADKAGCIAQLPELLYYRRKGLPRSDSEVERRAVADFLTSKGCRATVTALSEEPHIRRIAYAPESEPLISILIPNYEHRDVLKTCIDSIYGKSTYRNFEIVIVENNSRSPEIFAYYEELQAARENLRVVIWDKPFNYSAVNNYGARFCRGEYLLLLNNDTEVITPAWLEEMLMFAQRADVGVVGAKLLYPDGRVQHGGVLLGAWGLADHYFIGEEDAGGYMNRLRYVQDISAVTGACLLMRRSLFESLGGLDEELTVCFNDVDLCLKAREAGYQVVWTPFARLYHHESLSRSSDETIEKRGRLNKEIFAVRDRWGSVLSAGDASFNPNFKLKTPFAYKSELLPYPARCVRKEGGLLPERRKP